jgi:hypothetical protein
MKYFFLILFLFSTPPVFSADTSALLIGVVRSDGVIIPFASYDGSRWDTPWPAADTPVDTTLKTLDALPKKWYAPLVAAPREWYVRTRTGGFHAARVDRPVVVKSRCSELWGLAADPVKGSEDASREPQSGAVSKDGIALSRNIQIQPVAAVGKDSEEWRGLQSVIRAAFSAAENKKGHPLSPEVREREEFTLPVLFRGTEEADGSIIYYFEAGRNYVTAGLLPGTSPAGASFLRGWLRRDRAGALSFIQQNFTSERFSAPREPALVPLGILNPGGNALWVVQAQEQGSESYRILELGRTEVRVIAEMFGGGC